MDEEKIISLFVNVIKRKMVETNLTKEEIIEGYPKLTEIQKTEILSRI